MLGPIKSADQLITAIGIKQRVISFTHLRKHWTAHDIGRFQVAVRARHEKVNCKLELLLVRVVDRSGN